MPISRVSWGGLRLGGFLLGLGLLAACANLEPDIEGAERSVQVTSDNVTIAGPSGFCVDPTAIQNADDTGFVLLGNCAAISGSDLAGQPDVSAVLTAAVSAPSVGASLTANLAALDTFFRSEDGRALLSRSGDASSVQILATQTADDMFLLHARDTSGGNLTGVATDYWRAYLDIGPRLATLSVLALADDEVSDDAALDVLSDFASVVQAANSRTLGGVDTAVRPHNRTDDAQGPFLAGLFRRIFVE